MDSTFAPRKQKANPFQKHESKASQSVGRASVRSVNRYHDRSISKERMLSLSALDKYDKWKSKVSPQRQGSQQQMIVVPNEDKCKKVNIVRSLFGTTREGRELAEAFQKIVSQESQNVDIKQLKRLR